MLIYVLHENPDPDGVTDLKLDVDLCSIVPHSSLVPRGRACMLNKASLSHLLIFFVLRANFLLLYDVMLITDMRSFVCSMCKSIKIYFVESCDEYMLFTLDMYVVCMTIMCMS